MKPMVINEPIIVICEECNSLLKARLTDTEVVITADGGIMRQLAITPCKCSEGRVVERSLNITITGSIILCDKTIKEGQ